MKENKVPEIIPSSDKVNKTETQKKSFKKIYFVLLAFAILLGLVFVSKIITPSPQKEVTLKPLTTPLFLAINSPKAETTIVNGELLVKGKTLPNTTVLIYSDIDETSLESDSYGEFKDTILIGDQGGLVRITAYSDSGLESSKTIDIGGSSNVLGKSIKSNGQSNKEENIKGSSQNNTNSNGKNQAQTQNKASLNQAGEIKVKTNQKPISVADFLKNKGKTEKPVKIGTGKMMDILSEESTTGASLNKSLKLKKMDVEQASIGAELKRHALEGVITQISGGVITLAHQIQRDRTYTIYYNNNTVISMKDNKASGSASLTGTALSVGMRIAVVGIPADSGLMATRIHVIPGKAIGIFKRNPVSSTSATPVLSISPNASSSVTPAITATLTISPTIQTVSPTP